MSKKYPIAIDATALNEKQLHELKKILKEFTPETITKFPSAPAATVAKELANKGYPQLANQLPLVLSADVARVITSKCLQLFHPRPVFRTEPNPNIVLRTISTEQDYVRLVDDMVGTLDDESVCYLFSTDKRTSDVLLITEANPANNKLSAQSLVLTNDNYNKGDYLRQIISETLQTVRLEYRRSQPYQIR